MGFIHFRDYRTQLHRLSVRIRALSANPPKGFGHFKPITPFLLILGSIISGIWAEKLCRSEATRAWEIAHQPSDLIWENALGSRGFKALKELRLLQQTALGLPAMLDDQGTIWTTPEADWVAVTRTSPDSHDSQGFQRGESDSLPFNIYCFQCKAVPKSWESAGIGWTGFEATLKRIDQLHSQRAKTPEKGKKHFSVDAREIRY